MEANFDGMRRNATANMNELHTVLKELIDCGWVRDEFIEVKIIEAFNDAAQSVDVMNCLYDPNVEDDMNDLSDVLSIDRLDKKEEE